MKNPAQHREAEGLTGATRIASTQPDVGDAHLTFCNHEPLYGAGASAGTNSRVRSSLRFFRREIALHTLQDYLQVYEYNFVLMVSTGFRRII